MNIAQAIKHIENLKKNMANIVDVYGRLDETKVPGKVTVSLETEHGHRFYFVVSTEALRNLLEETDSGNKKEIERLQPIIDMADAALKGVLAGESKQ